MDWTGIAKTVGTTGVVVLVVGYFLRQVFQQVLSRDLEKFKADLSAKHDIETERLRNDLRIAASEHETRFTRLHETRAKTIGELYRKFVHASAFLDVYLNTADAERANGPAKKEDVKRSLDEFVEYFQENRIYFQEDLCQDIDAACSQYATAWIRTGACPTAMPPAEEQWSKAAWHFSDHFPPIRAKIERQFRELIGVKETQSNGQRTTDKGPVPQ